MESLQDLLGGEFYSILSSYPKFFSINHKKNFIYGYVKNGRIGYLGYHFYDDARIKEKLTTLGIKKLIEMDAKRIIIFASDPEIINLLSKLSFKHIRDLKLLCLKIRKEYVIESIKEKKNLAIKNIELRDIITLKNFYDLSLPSELAHTINELEIWYKVNKKGFYGAYVNNKLVGAVFGHRGPGGRGWIRGLVVDPRWRLKNIGSNLLLVIVDYFKSIGINEITALTFDEEVESNFYEKNGFTFKEIIKEFMFIKGSRFNKGAYK